MDASKITFESLHALAGQISYTDHALHFKELFSVFKPRTFLEWGCGYSTSLFLDNSKEVISVEFIVGGLNDKWLSECERMFVDRQNWLPVRYYGTPEINKACSHQSSRQTDYAEINAVYVEELDAYIKSILKDRQVDISFVDPGVYIRGDLVELSLQNNIPVVIAHDTANAYPDYPSLVERKVDTGLYGWFKIQDHPNYQKIFVHHGNGTTFWVRRDLPEVIRVMEAYAKPMLS